MEENEVVSIDHLNRRGWGVGSCLGGKAEVIGALPGDRLKVRLARKRRGKRRGDIMDVLIPSSCRVAAPCVHVPLCGGCTWQQMEYTAQLQEKETRVRKRFEPLLGDGSFRSIVPCADPWQYRNKMEFSFSQNRAGERFLGLIIAGSRGHVLNLSECHLVSSWFVEVLSKVRSWWKESGLTAYRLDNTGVLRTLIVREGKRTGNKLVMLTVSGNPAYPINRHQLKGFIEAVKRSVLEEEWPHLSIFLRVQQICKGSPTQFYEIHLHGPDHLVEKLRLDLDEPLELSFKVSPTSFFQPNSFQAEKLYTEAVKMVNFPKRHVLDLYAGTATLGLVFATRAEKVTAVELNPHACFDAQVNKEMNRCSNLEIICGDVGEKLKELRSREDFILPDLIVIDPPRTGLDGMAMRSIQELKPKEILYVSCNDETQAANSEEFLKGEYRIAEVLPMDQFPHTPHVENIVLFKRVVFS